MSQYAKSRQALRKDGFKQGISSDDARKKREDSAVQIRKEKRNESFQKRRNMSMPETSTPSSFGNTPVNTAGTESSIPVLYDMIRRTDFHSLIEATTSVRKLLSQERNPPIQEVIESGILSVLVQLLKRNDFPSLQFEAAWAITNIASGSSDQTRIVIDSGAVPLFKDLLSSPNDDVREQAVWALGNIAGDSPKCRDFVLSHGILDPLLLNIQESAKLSMLRNATWTLSNLCRAKPQPRWETISGALPTLAKLLYSTDDEILTDACWALSYLSDGPNDRIQAVIESGVARKMVELLLHTAPTVQTPALRTVGNLVTGDDSQTQVLINLQVLPCLNALLTSNKKGIKKEACWTISNISAGTKIQIQAVIDAKIVPRLITLLRNSDFDIRKEAAWALSNACSGGTPEHIKYLVDSGLIEPFCELLTSADPRIILVALEGIENLLKVGERLSKQTGINEYVLSIEEHKGVDNIEALQNHPNTEIYEKSIGILENYFQAEEENQNIAPNVNTTNHFTFDVGSSSSTFHF